MARVVAHPGFQNPKTKAESYTKEEQAKPKAKVKVSSKRKKKATKK